MSRLADGEGVFNSELTSQYSTRKLNSLHISIAITMRNDYTIFYWLNIFQNNCFPNSVTACYTYTYNIENKRKVQFILYG